MQVSIINTRTLFIIKIIIVFNNCLQSAPFYDIIRRMRKAFTFCFITAIFATTSNVAVAFNPFTGDYENQIAVNFAGGVNSGFLIPPPTQWVPFTILNIQYSQPTTFFKIPARQSINIAQTFGFGDKYGWHWDNFTIPMIYLSQDVALYCGKYTYASFGAGMGLQAQQNERLGAKLLFQFKLTAGYRITERTSVEAFVQHFSNANTADANHSYGFYGLGLTYNF